MKSFRRKDVERFVLANHDLLGHPCGMKTFRLVCAAEQVAAHLREEVLGGGLSHRMPGIHQLAAELGANHKTVATAVRMLEKERLLVPQGTGRSRKIEIPRGFKPPMLRVGILPGDALGRSAGYMIDLQHELIEAGHTVSFTPKTLSDLKMEVRRVAAMVKRNPADAWIVVAGSREVLEWFMTKNIPVLALFGRRRKLPIASTGPDKVPALRAATKTLIGLGHRRIVLLTRSVRRLPVPGAVEQAFLDALAAHGITPGPYHLPDWEESSDGFHARLESLFKVSLPTAMIVDEVPFFLAVQQFLAGRGLRVPENVSLVCTDASPDFAWYRPSVAHIRWDSRPVVRRVVRWAANVSGGRQDLRQTLTPAEFVPGGTVGPAGAGPPSMNRIWCSVA
jgi:DNA-binding LacI/PurR family transcriptional regulator